MKSEYPTFLRSKGKAMVVTLSDGEIFDHESRNDEDGNFFAFTTTAIVDESVLIEKNPLMGNSLSVPTYKKLIISCARLLQRMQ